MEDELNMRSSVTIKEVAAEASVSASTVSRAIRNHPDVSEETREKVLRVAAELGYHPSALARGLVSGKSMEIGLMVADIANPFYSKLARTVYDKANESDYSVMLCETRDDLSRSRRYTDRLLSRRIDGIIHASLGPDESVLQSLADANVPVVLANRRPRARRNLDFVAPDYVGAAKQATEYLISKGRKRILHLAGPEYASNSWEIVEGYKQALIDAGIAVSEGLILHGTYQRDSGYEITNAFLSNGHPLDAIFAVGDPTALGAMDAIADWGLRVPEDVAVMGCDNLALASLRAIQLSTVNLNIDKMGQTAWDLLLDAIQEPENHVPREVVIKTELIIRGTTG